MWTGCAGAGESSGIRGLAVVIAPIGNCCIQEKVFPNGPVEETKENLNSAVHTHYPDTNSWYRFVHIQLAR